ncbi:hypothetical protein [Psychrobacillus sp.]|uniref:hypothetical protein n=1 Tax=Psychrobacillus sp. TaxID=1871623 RepID=UPI0028BE8F96|nr:hypothetical protein [Psychrobacillus sp.]
MKKFTYILISYLCFALVFSSLSSNVVLANNITTDEEKINNAPNGENFDWKSVQWENTNFENTNDQVPVSPEDSNEVYEYIDLDPGVIYDEENTSNIINKEDFTGQQPYLWGTIARVVIVGGIFVVKFGTKIFKKQPAKKSQDHTHDFQPAAVNVGNGNTVVLQRSSMDHILQNHHPEYWTGATGKTLFNPSITSYQLRSQMIQILNQNRHKIDINGYGTIDVYINGQEYRLVVSHNRITTFYSLGL